MHTNAPSSLRQSYRDRYKRRHVTPHTEPVDERVSSVNERVYTVKLRRRRAQAVGSFYDNNANDEDEHIISKWTIVRQRLPDILALSTTYKPTSIRAQLVLLVALMNKESHEDINEPSQLNINEYDNTISHIVPTNVIIDINGRRRLICLKRIPSEQVIYVDVNNLSFEIPTRQFILSMSRGHAHETAAKYCPPAISDMLIDLSKSKIINDRLKYKRALFKMRLGQIIFFVIFMCMITMMLVLIIGATKTVFKLDSFNQTSQHTSIKSLVSSKQFGNFSIITYEENESW